MIALAMIPKAAYLQKNRSFKVSFFLTIDKNTFPNTHDTIDKSSNNNNKNNIHSFGAIKKKRVTKYSV